MVWKCKFCNEDLPHLNRWQHGSHVINCHQNPNRAQILAKAKLNCIISNSVPRLDFKQNCPTCRKEFVQILRQSEINNGKFRKFCSRVCIPRKYNFGNGFRIASKNRSLSRVERERKFRQEADILFEKNKNNPLFMLGIGLYWGEGSKTQKHFSLSNSDVGVIKHWILWLNEFASKSSSNFHIYGHEDVVPAEARIHWGLHLDVTPDKFKFFKVNPSSSKGKSKRKLLFGTLRVNTGIGGTEMYHKMMRWLELLRNS